MLHTCINTQRPLNCVHTSLAWGLLRLAPYEQLFMLNKVKHISAVKMNRNSFLQNAHWTTLSTRTRKLYACTVSKTNMRCTQLTHEQPHLLTAQLQTDTSLARDSQGSSHLQVSVVLHSTHQITGSTSLLQTSPSWKGEE